MGLGIGRALAALGGGLTGWGGDLADEQRRTAERDSQLSLRGYFRRAPKVELPAGAGVIEAEPQPEPVGGDILLDAVNRGAGRTLVPGMRPRPLSATLGMDPDFGDVGPDDVRAYAPGASTTRPSTETLEQLKGAIRQAAPKEYTDPVEMLGGTYDYRSEDTPEGRRQALQNALRERQQRAAYGAWRTANPGRSEPFEATDDWQAVMAQHLGHETNQSTIDPALNRRLFDSLPDSVRSRLPYVEGHDYKPLYDAYVRGEIGQQNRTEFRVMFPPGAGGGSTGEMTATQQRAQRLRQAEGRAATLAMQAYAGGYPNVVGVVRNYLRQEFRDISEGEIEGIAAQQARENRPRNSDEDDFN